MKRGVLLLNGSPYTGKIEAEGAAVYCCDGAYSWARGRVRIDKNVGDFDSLGYIPDPLPEEVCPGEKDSTDGEIALCKMLADGIDDITIYGGFGGRSDHFLGNLHLLYRAHAGGARIKMASEDCVIFPASGRVRLDNLSGKTLSVFPFSSAVHIMESRGLKYPYPPELRYGECRGVSNIVTERRAYIDVAEGETVLVIVNLGEV